MSREAILTIDIGTTSMRGILYDLESAEIAVVRKDTRPEHFPDGRVEQDPDTWRTALREILSDCARAAAGAGVEVGGIALTSQRSSVIPVDRRGEPLRHAIMWQDLRTEGLVRRLSEENRAVYAACGMRVTTVMSAVKMTWIRDNEPGVFARTHKMIGIHDFVLHQMTGRFVTDASLASRTNLLNLERRGWDPDLIRLFGLREDLLCGMVEPGSVIGSLETGIASETGLKSGIPVVSAGGDQQCAALGLGLVSADRIVTNTGTGSYLLAHSAVPVRDPGMRVFCNASAVPGCYVVEAGLSASGVIYRWFSDTLVAGEGGPGGPDRAGSGFDAVNAEAESAAPGCGGLIFLPHFKGSGAPHFNPGAKGLYYGLTLNTTRGDMARAVLEGIAADLADNLELLENLTSRAARIHASGGLARFGLFNCIQADMFGRPVLSSHGEATAMGAWVSASKALGYRATFAEALKVAEAASPPETTLPSADGTEVYAAMRRDRKTLYDSIYSDRR